MTFSLNTYPDIFPDLRHPVVHFAAALDIDVFGVEPDYLEGTSPDSRFPWSALMVEMEGAVPDDDKVPSMVDRELENLELCLRLFQPGDIAVRCHGFAGEADTGITWLPWAIFSTPVKPIVVPLHERPRYDINDNILQGISTFLDDYWDVLPQMRPPVQHALSRFNSSYERRDATDRLVDLIISLESLFNDGNPSGVTFKVALRCAAWSQQTGGGRETTFKMVKKAYESRSKIVHARKEDSDLDMHEVDALEVIVRLCLVKYLDLQKTEGAVPVGNEFDHLLLTGSL